MPKFTLSECTYVGNLDLWHRFFSLKRVGLATVLPDRGPGWGHARFLWHLQVEFDVRFFRGRRVAILHVLDTAVCSPREGVPSATYLLAQQRKSPKMWVTWLAPHAQPTRSGRKCGPLRTSDAVDANETSANAPSPRGCPQLAPRRGFKLHPRGISTGLGSSD